MALDNLLHGEMVYLNAITRDDIPLFGKWFSDIELLSYLWMIPLVPQTEEDEMEWFEQMRKSKDFTFAIRLIANDRLIGSISLTEPEWRNRSSTFGIAIGDRDYWGKGYGTDATKVILRYGFLELNLNRIELLVYNYNQRGIKSYEKVGFTHEGTRRQALFRDGDYHDVHLMAMLREEWVQHRLKD
jgi:RimJ/RimL family protein N-acetyltransferase